MRRGTIGYVENLCGRLIGIGIGIGTFFGSKVARACQGLAALDKEDTCMSQLTNTSWVSIS